MNLKIENQQVQQSKVFYEINDDAININNVSKDAHCQTPIKKNAQHSPSMNSWPKNLSLSNNSKSVQH